MDPQDLPEGNYIVERRTSSMYDLDRLMNRLDEHFKEEAKYQRAFGERFVQVESDIASVSSSMKKLADVLERLTVIEERDRSHNNTLLGINESLKDIKKEVSLNRDKVNEDIARVDLKVNKWIWSFSGVTATLLVIWSFVGSIVLNHLTEIDKTVDEVKIHLAKTSEPLKLK